MTRRGAKYPTVDLETPITNGHGEVAFDEGEYFKGYFAKVNLFPIPPLRLDMLAALLLSLLLLVKTMKSVGSSPLPMKNRRLPQARKTLRLPCRSQAPKNRKTAMHNAATSTY